MFVLFVCVYFYFSSSYARRLTCCVRE